MIVPISQIVNKAKKQKYAVGAFNTSNLEITLAIVRAAVKMKSPVIIQTSESAISYSNTETIFQLIKTLANTVGKSVPIAIHLDHGKDLKIIKDCLRVGYNSVHIDASVEEFQKNISLSRQVARLAHAKNIWVQAELGSILGKEGMIKLKTGEIDMKDLMTKPEQAAEFVAKTEVDTLAVSVGTIHGHFKGVEKVDQVRLQKIASQVKVPLVLHGGSGLDAKTFKTAIKNGISIINIDTNLRLAFKQALQKSLQKDSDLIDPRKILMPSIEAMQAEVEKMIKIFGSQNKA
ncbi:class II fructose-bisphosphate aldolase [Patescibacteria group bacterium]|nr:class II fructose-bisphosphate aldolase [Patescibacteria group bacterium]